MFVNGADSKSAQMFTLAPELAHLWIGQGGLFNLIKMMPHSDATERFCNQVAAEFLVAAHKLTERWNHAKTTDRPFHTIARLFKVSPPGDRGLLEAAERGVENAGVGAPAEEKEQAKPAAGAADGGRHRSVARRAGNAGSGAPTPNRLDEAFGRARPPTAGSVPA